MKSTIETFTYKTKEIQRVQKVELDNWEELNFFTPKYSNQAFKNLTTLYKDFIVKKYSFIFGQLVLFTLPENIEIPFDDFDEQYGQIYDDLTKVTIAFKKNIQLVNKKLCFKDDKTKDFYYLLEKQGCLDCAIGKRNSLTFLPVGKTFGFLSESNKKKTLKVNSNFFVMDKLDCGSIYDRISTPIGLTVKDGQILSAPLFYRDTFIVDKQNNISIQNIDLKQIRIKIDDVVYEHNKNAYFYTRDTHYKTDKKVGSDIVCINNKVVGLKQSGNCQIPGGGFVVHTLQPIDSITNKTISYCGFENVKFALQVGNAAIKNEKEIRCFTSKFYNFLDFYKPSFPPSMYPLNFNKARAPRIVLGTNKENKPVILWFEGAGKFGYEIGKESCGASLKEVATISKQLGLTNAINLDGGGSACIYLHNKKSLKVSDRDPQTYLENERAISTSIYVD